MAMLDYGAILKVNGKLVNLNSGLFMDMKEAVGFTIDKVLHTYDWNNVSYTEECQIDGNYFVYFGDEELLFASYKNLLIVVENKEIVTYIHFDYEEGYKRVKYKNIGETVIKVKKVDDCKLLATIQYKGNNYSLLYGYGIDNNVKVFKKISSKGIYGYNKKITRFVSNFLEL